MMLKMRIWIFVAAISCGLTQMATADHNQAIVSDIDSNGFGTFSGDYSHVYGRDVDHPWHTFNANLGDEITVTLETDFATGAPNGGSFLWLYEVIDGNAEIGDAPPAAGGTELTLLLDSFDDPDFTLDDDQFHTLTFSAPSTNQYIVQVDSWLGGDGPYTLTIVPEPGSMLLVLFGACAVLTSLRQRVSRVGK